MDVQNVESKALGRSVKIINYFEEVAFGETLSKRSYPKCEQNGSTYLCCRLLFYQILYINLGTRKIFLDFLSQNIIYY